jgi:hypothetical protein
MSWVWAVSGRDSILIIEFDVEDKNRANLIIDLFNANYFSVLFYIKK